MVNTQGDTLRGFIDYREWDKNPRKISYKESLESNKVQEFNPLTIQYFALDGLGAYQKYDGRISMGNVETKDLAITSDTSTAKVSVFLKLLQRGKSVSLYSYRDELKNRFFLQKANELAPQELQFRRYRSQTDNGNNAIINLKIYAPQLWNAATEFGVSTPELKRRIELAAYSEADLLQVVSLINHVSKEELKISRSAGSPKMRYFAGAGLSRTQLQAEPVWALTLDKPSYTSLLPKVSFGADTYLNPDVQQFFLRFQFSYALASFNVSSEDGVVKFNIKQSTFNIAPQLLYNFYNSEKFKFNIGGGGFYTIASYDKSTTASIKANQNTSSNSISELNFLPPLYYGYLLRTGIIINNKVDFSVLYLKPSLNTFFKYSPVQAEVNYLFNRKKK
ncbi:hypothetical protein [Adhaeribacter aquaticus]|uniref:hypothetical protein n=1 Tax=Adhaeribacter aquaticus TaxID=299567 RepID=UPI0012F8150B|nr:hypothetical protein [Adhaeribacter aquaticus]